LSKHLYRQTKKLLQEATMFCNSKYTKLQQLGVKLQLKKCPVYDKMRYEY